MAAKFEKVMEAGGGAPTARLSDHAGDVKPTSSLIDHIQGVMEHQKAVLARELHDELGGLLVGAVMDLAWAEQHLATPTAEVRNKLVRARQTLASAIDLKRKLIEDLRPTLLDNVGLFAAVRWHAQASCKRAGLACSIHLPDEERRFLPNVPIALFRIVQEALAVIVARKPKSGAELSITIEGNTLTVDLSGNEGTAPAATADGADAHYLAAIEQRVTSAGGHYEASSTASGGARITARFPIESMQG